MKSHPNPDLFPRAVRAALLSPLLVCGASIGFAQAAPNPPPPEDESVVLAPFVIEESEETGYIASSTLAGTRLRADLRDVPSQVSVMTREFLEDIGATTTEQAFAYSSNVAAAHEQPETSQSIVGTFFLRSGGGAQIRGMGSPTNSRSFFTSTIESDTYNTERVSIASGPNAILFGLGSPAGIVDTTMKAADLRRNRGQAVLRMDDLGSDRAELDVSHMLIPDTLAFRVAALRDRGKGFLKPSYDDQDRYYGTITYRPLRRLTLRVHGEKMERDAARPPFLLPFDAYTPWMANGSPSWRRGTPPANFRYLVANNSNRFLVVNGDTAADVAPANWNGTVDLKPLANYLNDTRPGDPLYMPGFRPEDVGPMTMRDESMYPVREYNIFGNTRVNDINGDFITAFAELQLARNLFIEFGYNRETREERAAANFQASQSILFYDANELLPASLGANLPNPNLGRPYVQGTPAGFHFNQREEELRATLSYELDLRDRNRWFGHHRLAGLLAARESTDSTQAMARRIYLNTDGSVPSMLTMPAVQPTQPNHMTAGNAARVIQLRTYLDLDGSGDGTKYALPYQGLSPLDDWYLPDPGAPGKVMHIPFFNTPEMGGVNGANAFRQQIDSAMAAYNGYFLNDRLVLTYGIRRDEAKNARLAGATQRLFNGLFPHFSTLSWGPNDPEVTLKNNVKGAVFHVPFPAKLQAAALSVFYNTATNNLLGSRALGVEGRQNPGQEGDGENYGFRLALLNDKLVVRVDWFENSANGAEIGGVAPLVGPMAELENRMYDIDPSYQAGSFDPVANGVSVYRPTFNQTNRGQEVEIVGNPLPGLSIRAVAGRGEPETSSAGNEWVAYAAERESVWRNIEWWDRSDPANPLPVVSWDRQTGEFVVGQPGQTPLRGWENVGWATGPNQPPTMSVQERWQANVLRDSYSLQNQIGRIAPQHREWRFSGTVAYSFQEGALRGLRTGVSARYRGKALIGYVSEYVPFGPNQVLAADLDQPVYAPDEWFFDVFAAYRGQLPWKSLRYRLQVNVQNVFDEVDIYPSFADSYGRSTRFAQFAGRTAALTAAIEF